VWHRHIRETNGCETTDAHPIKMLESAGSAAELIQNARPYYNLLFRAGAEKRSSQADGIVQ